MTFSCNPRHGWLMGTAYDNKRPRNQASQRWAELARMINHLLRRRPALPASPFFSHLRQSGVSPPQGGVPLSPLDSRPCRQFSASQLRELHFGNTSDKLALSPSGLCRGVNAHLLETGMIQLARSCKVTTRRSARPKDEPLTPPSTSGG